MHIRPLTLLQPIHFRFTLFTIIVPLLMATILLFNNTALALSDKSSNNIKPIISVEWLLKHNTENYLLVDVRGNEEYMQGHIENAIHIPIEETFNHAGDTIRIAPIYHVQKFLSAAGVKNTDSIIIYDNGDLKNSAHFFWLLETYNHEKVSVLDGGYPSWVKNKGKISTKGWQRPASHYIASISPKSLATRLSTRQ